MAFDPGSQKDYWFKRRCIGTELKFTIMPRECYFTGKILWFVTAYKQTSMILGPGEPIFEYRWYNKQDFLIERIKGTV
jgi:hypothetical protein